MPKSASKKYTVKELESLKNDGRYFVGYEPGLFLNRKGGSASWILRIMVQGQRRDFGLGSFCPGLADHVPLQEANSKAFEIRKSLRDGNAPPPTKRDRADAARAEAEAEARAKAAEKTFRECAEAYIAAHSAGWKNAKHALQWAATLETYAYPKIGKLAVAKVDTGLVLEIIEPLWATKTETASRLRGRIEKVLGWATFRGYREGENPARWKDHLDHQLPLRSEVRKVEHHAALPYAEIGAFMAALRQREGVSARALEFAVLCASRSGEVRLATRREFDLDAGLWIIPADRMKAGKEHRVPLPAAAVAILKALPAGAAGDFMFPAPRGGALSDMALTAVLKRMGRGDLTQHGMRSTFRDWAGETTSYPREVIEHALAHQLKDKAEAAYQRGDLLTKRSRLMADWSTYCGTVSTPNANVVPINATVAA